MYRLLCHCGQETTVRGSQAGSQVTCKCGRVNLVPPLRVLKESELKDEPTRLGSDSSDAHNAHNFKPRIQFHFACGKVRHNGNVSSWAMNHYVDLLLEKVTELILSNAQQRFSEMIVAIALGPFNKKRIEFDVYPKDAEIVDQVEITEALSSIAAPPVHHSPIAFALFVQKEYVGTAERRLDMFPSLTKSIESLGMVEALKLSFTHAPRFVSSDPSEDTQIDAPDESRCNGTTSPAGLRWWQRLLVLLGLRGQEADVVPVEPASDTSLEERFDKQMLWFEECDALAAQSSLIELKQLIVTAPNDFRIQVAYAEKLREHQAWESAIEWYDKFVEFIGPSAVVLGRRAALHQRAGHLEAALRDYTSAIEDAPNYPAYRLERSHIYRELAAWDQAQSDLDEAIQLAPIDPIAYCHRATVQLHRNRLADALEDLRKAVWLDPNFGYAHYQLGWLYANHCENKVAEAVKHFSRAVDLARESDEIRYHRSLAYLAQNKYELALEDCDHILKSKPDHAETLGVRGRVLQCDGRYDEAIVDSSRSIELGHEHALVYLSRAISYACTDRTELAIQDCDVALALDPNNVWAIQFRGRLQLQAGDLDAAMDAFSRARELAPEWTEPREHVALVHRMKENPQGAVEEQTLLIDQQPNQASHYINRAFAYAQMHAYAKAALDYDKAIMLEPANERLYYLRGTFRVQCQERELALADFEHVLTLTGGDDDARVSRAMLLLELRRFDEAVEGFTQLLSKYPDHVQAYAGRAIAFAALGNSQGAKEDSDRLGEVSPEMAEEVELQTKAAALYSLVHKYDYDGAFASAEQIIAQYPEKSLGYRLRGYVHWEREEYVEAVDDYSQVLKIDGPRADCLSSRGQLLAELGEYQRALADLDESITMARKAGQKIVLAYALNGRALAFSGMERDEDSTRDFGESVGLCPTNPWVYYHRGIRKFHLNQWKDAKNMLELALDLKDPPLSKRKILRAEAVLKKIANGA